MKKDFDTVELVFDPERNISDTIIVECPNQGKY